MDAITSYERLKKEKAELNKAIVILNDERCERAVEILTAERNRVTNILNVLIADINKNIRV